MMTDGNQFWAEGEYRVCKRETSCVWRDSEMRIAEAFHVDLFECPATERMNDFTPLRGRKSYNDSDLTDAYAEGFPRLD